MKKTFILVTSFVFSLGLLSANEVSFKPVFSKLKFTLPVAAVVPPDDTGRLFLVEQGGRILILPEDRIGGDSVEVFLDFTGRDMIAHAFEEGLLGLVFHPDFKKNRKFYVYYSLQHPKRTILSEMEVFTDKPNRANLSTERKLLEIPQPFWNHNSGNMTFGPDGMLYLAVGDGGKRDDVRRSAQNPFMFNGKVLRLDVNARSKGLQYGIPPDNPFVGKEGMRGEIWALGLRNPWGMDYDHKTGVFWLADVGQDLREEVNHIRKGANYGWSFREADLKFVKRGDSPPKDAVFEEPVAVYGRPEGVSITGGIVYYGKRHSKLKGHFLYGDWGTGHVWAVGYDAKRKKVAKDRMIFRNNEKGNPKKFLFKPSVFVSAPDGETLVFSWTGGAFEMVN